MQEVYFLKHLFKDEIIIWSSVGKPRPEVIVASEDLILFNKHSRLCFSVTF